MLQVANNAVVNVQYDPMELLKKYEKDIKDLKVTSQVQTCQSFF